MGYVIGESRDQVMMLALDDMVAEDSMVRIIDRFIEVCDLKKLGFTNTERVMPPSRAHTIDETNMWYTVTEGKGRGTVCGTTAF